MESLLDIDRIAATQIKEVISANSDLLAEGNTLPALLEDCFNLLLSSSAKLDSFNMLKNLSDPNFA